MADEPVPVSPATAGVGDTVILQRTTGRGNNEFSARTAERVVRVRGNRLLVAGWYYHRSGVPTIATNRGRLLEPPGATTGTDANELRRLLSEVLRQFEGTWMTDPECAPRLSALFAECRAALRS